MIKRVFVILALAAAALACSPTGGGTSPGASLAPIGSDVLPSVPGESAPTESMAPIESPSPSAS